MADADRLKQLYDTRHPAGMSQERFGELYGIGTKAMVWQYLTGYRPLNYDAAAKFAKGLQCTIADISPELARKLKTDILPMLGKVSGKALVALMMLPPLLPTKAEAAFNNTFFASSAAKIHTAFVSILKYMTFVFRPLRYS